MNEGVAKEVRNVMKGLFENNARFSTLHSINVFTDINPRAKLPECYAYAFRLDAQNYTFMIQFMPHEILDVNYRICCYISEFLNNHIAEARKGIPFTDLDGKERFHIEDGGKICIKPKHGKIQVQECRYADWNEYVIGGVLYNSPDGVFPDSIAYDLESDAPYSSAEEVFPLWSTLPKDCLYVEPQSGNLIKIRRAIRGYEIMPGDNPFTNRDEAYRYNRQRNLTNGQVEAMFYGCMHSWADPQANPVNYNAKGEYVKE